MPDKSKQAASMSQGDWRSLVSYNPATGQFYWLVSRGRVKVGDLAGRPNSHKPPYLDIRFEGRNYRAHRVAWLLTYGLWPENSIDHINGDRCDNRVCNLREATISQNQMNKGRNPRNPTGLKGVSRNASGSYRSLIKVGQKQIYLGSFPTAESAHRAYCEAAGNLHGEFAKLS